LQLLTDNSIFGPAYTLNRALTLSGSSLIKKKSTTRAIARVMSWFRLGSRKETAIVKTSKKSFVTLAEGNKKSGRQIYCLRPLRVRKTRYFF